MATPVESFLAMRLDVIAEVFEDLAGEILVDRLDLLKAGDVRRGLFQPALHRLDAGLDAVDVPGGDFHEIPADKGTRAPQTACQIVTME